ncbi:MAG: Xaa-Pro peptidase family protein [Actinobacteria bacterium]|nr:Xaa-Pro peptidase family protein [Actinomycetota bacterium]
MAQTLTNRLERASRATAEAGLGALIVTPSADLTYLTGYDPPPLERLTALVIRPGTDPILIVPELERSRAEAADTAELAEIVTWRDGEEPYSVVAKLVRSAERVGASDRMWATHLLPLQAAAADIAFEPASNVLSPLRAVKDGDEIEALRRAARGADDAYHRILGGRFEGAREEEIAERLGGFLTDAGHDQVTFTIVATGPNGASPHHEPGGRTILAGDAVVMDFGGRVGGYCSDVTRTVAVQRGPRDFDHVYSIVAEAQEAAFQAVKPGVPAEEIDMAAREIIHMSGYADRFIHRTGHGIGLEEHEPPYIVTGNKQPLEPGMCFSIEPGIYMEGEFGVRIEDIVTVTDTGAQRLNHAPRDLQVVN